MNKYNAFELSVLVKDMCVENNVQVETKDRLWDVTVKMVKKQDAETLEELYQTFYKRTSQIAVNLIAAIEEEWNLRVAE